MISLICVVKMKVILIFSNVMPDAFEEIDYYDTIGIFIIIIQLLTTIEALDKI